MIRLAFLVTGVLLIASACGGVDDSESSAPTPVLSATPGASPTPYTRTEPTKQPTEFRVAFINLMSPLTLDANDPVADTTFDDRMGIIIEELRAFSPDLVAFNEASVTKAHGSAAARLARDLKMELQYARANPWFPGQSKEQSDEIAKQIGLEEGELVLSKWPILRAERRGLNPRTSETGEGRAALHLVIKGPPALGEMDVYVTHLTGGGDKVRAAQAADFVSFIKQTHATGPLLVMGGMSDPVGSLTYEVYDAAGLKDIGDVLGVGTCCRDKVIGIQPPLKDRTDFLLTEGWPATSVAVFGDVPKKRADGTMLYGSDHNGLLVVFPITWADP